MTNINSPIKGIEHIKAKIPAKNKKNKIIRKTEKGPKVYKVGDNLVNGFIIKDISEIEVSVDISNGYKKYRLSLQGLKK